MFTTLISEGRSPRSLRSCLRRPPLLALAVRHRGSVHADPDTDIIAAKREYMAKFEQGTCYGSSEPNSRMKEDEHTMDAPNVREGVGGDLDRFGDGGDVHGHIGC